jgi:putative protease
MTKLIVIPHTKKIIKKLIDIADGYILSVNGLSTNTILTYDLEELIKVIKYLNKNNKDIFISLNKNMHNSDLEQLKYILTELDNYNITGILYYDISIVNIHNSLGLKTNLVWSQEHLTTNSTTCNYWYKKGIKYAYLSSDITLEEILDIKKNTNMSLLVPLFGYLPMMVSKRNLVKNYLEYSNINDDSVINYMQAGDNIYPIIDNKEGTFAYSAHILNGLEDYFNISDADIPYITLNSFNISDSVFTKVIKIFKEVTKENIKDLTLKIDKMFKNTDRGFLHKATIYKVKKNESK